MALRTAIGLTIVSLLSLTLHSCLFVKAPEQKSEPVEDAALSPLPEIAMSDELVRSAQGDMIALLPEDWLVLDPKEGVSDHVITVAVNPEYTLSAVFAIIPDAGSTRKAFEDDGLLGLARIAFTQRTRRTAASVKLVGTYSLSELGTRQFGLYTFTGPGGGMKCRSAVFTSTLGNFYEFTIVPTPISNRDIPADLEQQAIFNSILATIQY